MPSRTPDRMPQGQRDAHIGVRDDSKITIILIDAVDPVTGDSKSIRMQIDEEREIEDLMKKFSASRVAIL
jgi:hypothetical protein